MIIGADIALRHGALVTEEGKVLYYFTDGDGMASSSDGMYSRAIELVKHTPQHSTVCIDWDRTMGNWRDPTVGVLITMQVAFYGALATHAGCKVHYITPALIRYCLALPETCHKEVVHDKIKVLYNIPHFGDDKHGDMLDAYILTLTWDCTKQHWGG